MADRSYVRRRGLNHLKKEASRVAIVAFIMAMLVKLLDSQPSTDVSPTPSPAVLKKENILLQFQILESGGMIDFTLRDPTNTRMRDSLRAYGKKLEATLRAGRFDLLFAFVPRNDAFGNWLTRNNGVGFSVTDLPAGVRLDIASSTQAMRTAVHEFIRDARGTPLTPDEKRKNHPGIDLGRDAQPADPGK
jgi:hypothetical protein